MQTKTTTFTSTITGQTIVKVATVNVTPSGNKIHLPVLTLSIEEAQELLSDLGEVLGISDDEADFRQADDSIGGGITS